MPKILFVCTGNICRSPTAEAIFRHQVAMRGLQSRFSCDSAGIQHYHAGQTADPRTIKTAADAGIIMDDLRARALTAADFVRFDYLLAMDRGHLHAMQQLVSPEDAHKLHLYLPFSGYPGENEVPDPYYGTQKDFDRVLAMIEQASTSLLDKLS